MQRCIILAARRYDFRDDDGQRREGCTLVYLTGDEDHESDRRGLFPLTIGAPLGVWHDLRELPGHYLVDFKQRPGKGGRPQLQAVGVQFVEAAEFVQVEV